MVAVKDGGGVGIVSSTIKLWLALYVGDYNS